MVRVKKIRKNRLPDVISFLKEHAKDHPELGEGTIVNWQKCNRFIAVDDDDNIVGYMAQIPHDFIRKNKSNVMIGWGVTLVLDMRNDDIRKEAGRALLTRTENNGIYYSAVGVVPIIEEPYKRRGLKICRKSSNFYAYFYKPEKLLSTINKKHLSWLVYIGNKFLGKRGKDNSNIRKIYNFRKAWDNEWNKYLSKYEMAGTRTAEFLNYKTRQPNKEYLMFVYGEEFKSPSGYIILREAHNDIRRYSILKICDIVGSKKAKVALLKKAKEIADNIAHIDAIIGISSVDDARSYRKAGIWVKKPYPIATQKKFTEKIHVTFFDSDLDNLW